MTITFLGTGTSTGVPLLACDCPVCLSQDPRDKRTRPALVVQGPGGTILVDAGPDLRTQCLAQSVRRVDACILTHTHADHLFGLDDLLIGAAQREVPNPAPEPGTLVLAALSLGVLAAARRRKPVQT